MYYYVVRTEVQKRVSPCLPRTEAEQWTDNILRTETILLSLKWPLQLARCPTYCEKPAPMKTVEMLYVIFLVLILQVMAVNGNFLKNLFTGAKGGSMQTVTLKTEILNLAKKTERGLTETAADKETMLNLFEQLEKKNKYKDSLNSPLINAIWNLEYTTSDSILGRNGSKRIGRILQTIDGPNLFAKNTETLSFLGFLNVPRSVTAALTPMNGSKVAVQFKKFTVGPIGFNAPDSFKGELDITYIDEDLRLSRGDKGNIFVLTKYAELEGSTTKKSVSI